MILKTCTLNKIHYAQQNLSCIKTQFSRNVTQHRKTEERKMHTLVIHYPIHLRSLTTIIALICSVGLHAQETVPATGNDATGTGGSSSYTVGQVVCATNTGSNGSVAQGVQQPYEISTSVGIEVTEINLELVAYPNPTNNSLTLNIGNYNNEKLTYQLYDMQGKLLDSKQAVNSCTTIGMKDLPTSTYLLNVLDNNSLIKTFRIVKN